MPRYMWRSLDSVIYNYIEKADCACVENAFLFVVLKIGGARASLGPPLTTPLVYSRDVQNFWGLMLQTPNWKLAQNMKVCQVSDQSEVVLPSPQCPEDVWPTFKDGLWLASSWLYGHGKTCSDGLETLMFWANFQFGV